MNAFHELPVAAHEAGHTVVALALGIKVEKVDAGLDRHTVVGSAFTAAICAPEVAREDALRMVMFSLAGLLHETILAGIADPDPPGRDEGRGHGDDVTEAYRFSDRLDVGKPRRAALHLATQATIELLGRNRDAAEAIAAELRDRCTLTGHEAEAIWAWNGGRMEPPEFVANLLSGLDDASSASAC